MKYPPLLLILYLATCILTFGIRGGFERMWFWYANRLAATAAGRGGGVKQLVPGSKSAQSNFNDVIRFINNKPDLPDVLKPLTFHPPVDATAKLLNDMKLTGPYFHQLQARQRSEWEETRQSDYDKYLIKELKRRAKAANLDIKFETFTHMRSGEPLPVLDVDKTLRTYSVVAEMEKVRKWIVNEQNIYLTEAKDEDLVKRRNHHVPLQQLQTGPCFTNWSLLLQKVMPMAQLWFQDQGAD
ncbi:hypothetical protein BDV06DRAFT_220628 [Aspergillus oleicola]